MPGSTSPIARPVSFAEVTVTVARQLGLAPATIAVWLASASQFVSGQTAVPAVVAAVASSKLTAGQATATARTMSGRSCCSGP
jgi:hypothetical protein